MPNHNKTSKSPSSSGKRKHSSDNAVDNTSEENQDLLPEGGLSQDSSEQTLGRFCCQQCHMTFDKRDYTALRKANISNNNYRRCIRVECSGTLKQLCEFCNRYINISDTPAHKRSCQQKLEKMAPLRKIQLQQQQEEFYKHAIKMFRTIEQRQQITDQQMKVQREELQRQRDKVERQSHQIQQLQEQLKQLSQQLQQQQHQYPPLPSISQQEQQTHNADSEDVTSYALRLSTEEQEKRDRQLKEQMVTKSLLSRGLATTVTTAAAAIPPLITEEESLVEAVLSDKRNAPGGGDGILSEFNNIRITLSDIQRLRPKEWLNDEIINFYMSLLLERNKQALLFPCSVAPPPKIHIFNTFFYLMLEQHGYCRVSKWTKKVDLFSLEKVLVPVHLANHWCLAVINLAAKRFEYYDSLGSSNDKCLQILRAYLASEFNNKKGGVLDLSDWKDFIPKDIPQQNNSYDCGLFACRFAECVSRATDDSTFNFSQADMPSLRKRLVLDILNKSISA